jgi:hypothetical protein
MMRARARDMREEIVALCRTWDEQWDCSRTPGHKGMSEAIEHARDAYAYPHDTPEVKREER